MWNKAQWGDSFLTSNEIIIGFIGCWHVFPKSIMGSLKASIEECMR